MKRTFFSCGITAGIWMLGVLPIASTTTVIDFPTEERRANDYFLIERIERNDTATIFYMTVRNQQKKFTLNEDTELLDMESNPETNKRKSYPLLRMEGIEMDELFPFDRDTPVKLTFAPLDPQVKEVEFFGHSWYVDNLHIFGIQVTNDNNSSLTVPDHLIIDFPKIDGMNDRYFNIEQVERTDTSTIFHMRITYTKRFWIDLPRFTYLKDRSGSRTYQLLRAEGFELDSMYFCKKHNQPFTLYFEPLSPSTKHVDFITGHDYTDYRITGIKLDENSHLSKKRIHYHSEISSDYPLWRTGNKTYGIYKVTVSPEKTELFLRTKPGFHYIAADSTATLQDRHSCKRYKLLSANKPMQDTIRGLSEEEPLYFTMTFEPLHSDVNEFNLLGSIDPTCFSIQQIDVPPPPAPLIFSWQEVALMIGGTVLLLGGSGAAIGRFRIRRVRKREENKRLITELQLKAIRSQMNPHFIFNALASIQHLINCHQEEKANEYLIQFSRLLRRVLASSEKPLVALSDEIELLTLYLQLEQLRVPFEFRFDIDPRVNQDEEIPGMLLQPIVENAVIHGLKEQTGGYIEIAIRRETDTLVCEITDDGTGIDRSSDKTKKKDTDNGFGLRSTAHRLLLLNRKLNTRIGVRQENWEKNGKNGTRVTLIIPI